MGERLGEHTEGLSDVAIAVSATVWASGQIIALAIQISASTELTLKVALVVATTVALVYTAFLSIYSRRRLCSAARSHLVP